MARTAKPDRATPEIRVCVEAFCFLAGDGSERMIMAGQRLRPDSEPVRRRPSSFIDPSEADEPVAAPLGGWRSPPASDERIANPYVGGEVHVPPRPGGGRPGGG